MNVTVKVTKRKDTIARHTRGVKAATADAAWSTAQLMLREMQQRVRRRNSHPGEVTVAESLRIIGKHGDETVQVGSRGAHRNRPVARWLEMGRHGQRAHPYIRPSAARGRRALKEQTEANVRRATSD